MRRTARTVTLLCSLGFALCLLAGSLLPAVAEGAEFKKGDEVIVDVYGDGKEVWNGVVKEVYHHASGTVYSVMWDSGAGYTSSNSGSVPASRLRPRGTAKRQATPAESPDQRRDPGEPEVSRPASVSVADLDYFFGGWNLTKWGGGSTVEREGYIYKEYLLHVSQGAPLTINSNGTYSWTGRDGKPLRGDWRKLRPDEDNITGGKNGLVLLKALDGKDWQIDFRGVSTGKDLIKVKCELGSFDGQRAGASKGEPAWNRVQFAPGEAVVVTLPGGEQCNGVIDKTYTDYTGTVFYNVNYTESDGRKSSGKFQAIKIRRR